MATQAKRTKLGPGEELIGTITPHGIRLTKDARRAQLAYREREQERERVQTPPRGGLLSLLSGRRREPGQDRSGQRRAAHRSIEWRISWSSDAPFRMHFAVARWTVPTDAAGVAPMPAAPPDTADADQPDQRATSPRRESTSRREAAPKRERRTKRVAVGPGERQPPLETGRGSRARSRPH